ncbi:MAG: UDP-N-acetylmuramate dehydrogenase [Bacteroidota bacterium]|uniref:UDP-N-acetylmuramate dehydrogenase n=1 Tax=Hydrotalea lipotrueae TaxID=2803817 RepID=UPI001C45223E|nr:UDP-N-acetylmuramate dehydrogenase [Hydrotalea lipotrueae]
MQISRNISLQPYNTFGIEALAENFAVIETIEDIATISKLTKQYQQWHLLGGGSNILFTDNLSGLTLYNQVKGIFIVQEDETTVLIKAFAGEKWNDLVQFCLQHNFAGVENLSLIPGSVGAAPIQNIGAYGVELKDVLEYVEAYHLDKHETEIFSNKACRFGYRDSIFKQQYKNRLLIVAITLRLNKIPKLVIGYGSLQQQLEKMGIVKPTIQQVAEAVNIIRTNKLPDPAKIGNAGSFFKNPTISKFRLHLLSEQYADIPGFALDEMNFKISAAWLIEQAGWKGKREGNVGCNPLQPLVIVNYGGATGKEIYNFSEAIIQSVKQKFGIELEREVNIW